MSKETSPLDYLIILLAASVPCIGFLVLSGWFAYLQNGYWGWPFAVACLSASGIKSWKDRKEEEREEAIKRAEAKKTYGDIFKN